MTLDATHPLNRPTLRYLGREGKGPAPAFALPGSVPDAYYGQGSHPDVVERVWDQLGGALPVDCRCLVHGTPALVHPGSGVILAICNGTRYNLRLTPAALSEAIRGGLATTTRWSSGEVMDAAEVLGPDWIFGAWHGDEPRWCQAAYAAFGGPEQQPGSAAGEE